jgi:hypothetical protein
MRPRLNLCYILTGLSRIASLRIRSVYNQVHATANSRAMRRHRTAPHRPVRPFAPCTDIIYADAYPHIVAR